MDRGPNVSNYVESFFFGGNYTAARHSAVTRIRDVAVDCWVARLGLARYVINPRRSRYKKRSHQAQRDVRVANCS